MARHDGVSCDSCMKSNFSGDRFKCLRCYDFDLCRQCYEQSRFGAGTEHSADHPVQCVMTRDDFEFTYWGEPVSSDEARNLTFTCPFCADVGFSQSNLYDHIRSEHADTAYEVICPVCVATPNADPNRLTEDLVSHLSSEHINRTARSSTEDALASAAGLPPTNLTTSNGARLQRRVIGNGPNRQFARRGGGRTLGFLSTAAANNAHRTRASAAAASGPATTNMFGNGLSTNTQATDNDPIADLLTQYGLQRGTGGDSQSYAASLAQIQQIQQQLAAHRVSAGSTSRQARRVAALRSLTDQAGGTAEPSLMDDVQLLESVLLRDPNAAELWSDILVANQSQQAASNVSNTVDYAPPPPATSIALRAQQAVTNTNNKQTKQATNQTTNNAQSTINTSWLDDDTQLDDLNVLWPDARYATPRHIRAEQPTPNREEIAQHAQIRAGFLAEMLALTLQQD